ncbi:MAG: CopG family transcriptional regulator [Candidatus Eisenbacteria bacterium]|nr:CopG family transcriptional regulator [Candidatus Eisenbacteria bacterium]
MGAERKWEVITFKADAALAKAMRSIPNRSEFIRAAILASLEGTCPLCGGTGTLSPDQHRHWRSFIGSHALVECDDCHAVHLRCQAGGGREDIHHRELKS